MKASYRLFVGLSLFYAVMGVIYYVVGGEAVGITCISLSSGLAGIVGFTSGLTATVWAFFRKIISGQRSLMALANLVFTHHIHGGRCR